MPFFNPGDILDNRYQITEVLGQGGFGTTYKARDLRRDNEIVVVKQLKNEFCNAQADPRPKQLFHREAKTLLALKNSQMMTPKLETNVIEHDGYVYFVMEYIQGKTLEQQELQEGNMLSEEEVVKLLKDMLRILNFIHKKGFLHRDIKPDNIMRRDGDNGLTLIDFGSVTKIVPPRNWTPIGNQDYCAPEQLNGQAEPSSDLYSLGIMAIQGLTGREPQHFDFLRDPETQDIHLNLLGTNVSVSLKKLIEKMVRHTPSERYQTVEEVLQGIQEIEEPEVVVDESVEEVLQGIQEIEGPEAVVSESQERSSTDDGGLNPIQLLSILLFCIGICIGAVVSTRLLPSYIIPRQIEEKSLFVNSGNRANKLLTKTEECLKNQKIDPEERIYQQNDLTQVKALKKKLKLKPRRIAIMIPGQGNEDCIGDTILAYSLEGLRGIADSQKKLLLSNNNELIQIVIVNYNNDEKNAEELANEIANDLTILGVIVIGSSSNNKTVLDVIKKSKNLVMITPTASGTTVGENIANFYRTNSSDQRIAQKIADYFSKKAETDPIKKVAIFYTTEEGESSYSNLLKRDIEQILQNNPIKLDFINVHKKSWKNEYNQLKNSKVDGIIVLPEFDELDWAIDLIKYNSSSENLPIFGGDTLSQGQVIKSAGEAAKGTIISVSWAYSSEYCYQGEWGGAISWRTATSYDALQAFIHAIKAHDGKNINRSSIRQKIREVNLSGGENCETSGKPLRFYDNLGQKLDRKPDLVEITDDKERCKNRQYPNSNLCYSQLSNKD